MSKKIFYTCTKTLTMEHSGRAAFVEGKDYELIREHEDGSLELTDEFGSPHTATPNIEDFQDWKQYFKIKS